MKTLKELDQKYVNLLQDVSDELVNSHEEISKNYRFDLSKVEISEAIILRLRAYYNSQGLIKKLLDKNQLAAASDFFVESVLFYLKLYLKQKLPNVNVYSEKEILLRKFQDEKGKNKREIIRPDISIYRGNELLAIVECKTQLGRIRPIWESEHIKRKNKIEQKFPDTKIFLLVMTGLNWDGFGKNAKFNDEYFCLLDDVWPTKYDNQGQIMSKIEDLFTKFLTL